MRKRLHTNRLPAAFAAAGLIAGALGFGGADAALGLSTKECSAKYKAAKDAGTLGDQKWNDFRKAQCGAEAAPAAAAPAPATEKGPEKKAAAAPATKSLFPKITSGGAVFPSALSAKFSSETPSKQRFHTCLEQYNSNKANGGNGDLKWIQKGGGYYSQCNARLKQ